MCLTAVFYGFMSILIRGKNDYYISQSKHMVAVYIEDDSLDVELYKEHIKIGSEFYNVGSNLDRSLLNYPEDLKDRKVSCFDIMLSGDKQKKYTDVVIFNEFDYTENIYTESVREMDAVDVDKLDRDKESFDLTKSDGTFKIDTDGTLSYYCPNNGELCRVSGMWINDGSVNVKHSYAGKTYFIMEDDTIVNCCDMSFTSRSSIKCHTLPFKLDNVRGVYISLYANYVHVDGGYLYRAPLNNDSPSLLVDNVISTTFDIPRRKTSIKGAHTMVE